jgi:hypothetical protein
MAFLADVERLKLVERKAYVSDISQRENSAKHSWHLSLGLLAVAQEVNLKIDLHKALVMALIRDVCEIDAGDTPAFGPQPLGSDFYRFAGHSNHQRLIPRIAALVLDNRLIASFSLIFRFLICFLVSLTAGVALAYLSGLAVRISLTDILSPIFNRRRLTHRRCSSGICPRRRVSPPTDRWRSTLRFG